MAATITSDFQVLYNANTSIGGADTFSGFQRFGTACNGGQVSRGVGHFTTTVPAFDLNGKRISTWMTAPASVAPFADGGYRIVIGDGTNTRAYYVGGGDVASYTQNGWNCFVLDGTVLPTAFAQLAGGGQPNLSAITVVGIGFNITTKAVGNSPNVFWDIMQIGTGITVAGGTAGDPATFDDIVDWDSQLSTATGTMRKLGDGVYSAQFGFVLGSVNADSHFEDKNSLIYFEGVPTGTLYKVRTQGSASHTNIVRLGERLGTGSNAIGVSGVTIQSLPFWTLDTSDVNCTTELLGSTFRGAGNGVLLGGELRSCTINNSAQAIVGTTEIKFSTLSGTTSTVAALRWNPDINISDTSFNGNFAGIEYQNEGTFTHNNLNFAGNEFDINFSGSGDLLINATGTSNTSTFTITGSGTVTVDNPVSLTFTGLQPDTEVRIYDPDTMTELAGIENTSGSFSFQFNFTPDTEIIYVIFNIQFQPIKIRIILPANDTSLPIQQVFDRVYRNP